jgi:hypothetical protein
MRRRDRSTDHPDERLRPLNPAADDSATSRLSTRSLWALIAAGFALRLLLACTTWGTGDAISFLRFAYSFEKVGLFASYASDPLLNHPPLPVLGSWLALRLARHNAFACGVLFRIAVICADFASAMLLRRIVRLRGNAGEAAALGVAAMYAWNPCAVLISGYHCNTDPVVALLSLLAVHLLEDRARPLLAGLALGLAINIKLIPVLLIPPLFLTTRGRREALMLFAGLAVMAIPFLPPLLSEPAFRRHVLGYTSSPDPWGVLLLLRLAFPSGVDAVSGEVVSPDHPAIVYNRWGRWVVLACAIGWGILARRVGRFDRLVVASVTYALFLVLAPGFGVQYLVLVAPLFYVTAPLRFANAYGLASGAFLLAVYHFYWDGGWPVSSMFHRPFPNPLAVLGLLPWGMLLWFLVAVVPRRSLHAWSAVKSA